MPELALASQAYMSRSLPFSAQRLVNLYPEFIPDGTGKTRFILHGTPGLNLFATAGVGPIRGMEKFGSLLYVVSGQKLYSITSLGAVTEIGPITGTERCYMAHNRTQLMIVPGGDTAYLYTVADGLATITDEDFPGADSLCALDGYFIVHEPDTDKFYVSALNDGTSWDALDFATAEARSDALVTVFEDHRELWLFGEETVEVWYNSAASEGAPFDRVSGAVMEKGCAAKFSPAKLDNTVFWLGNDLMVYRADGYLPKRISTHGIEYLIAQMAETNDAIGFAYNQEGHAFYVLIFPTGNRTLVYDIPADRWHERSTYLAATDGRWRVNGYAFFGNKHLVSDFENGAIYEMDLDHYQDAGGTIRRIATGPAVFAGGKEIIFDEFRIDVESGVGLTSGQGADPQAMLRWSDDGAKTWSNELWATMGAIGDYSRRVVWNALGSSRQRYFEVTISDPVKVAITATYWEGEVLPT